MDKEFQELKAKYLSSKNNSDLKALRENLKNRNGDSPEYSMKYVCTATVNIDDADFETIQKIDGDMNGRKVTKSPYLKL